MTALVEVRRLLHTNYNCVDLVALERWYTELFAVKPVMRSHSEDTDGIAFGLRMPTAHRTVFLYDHRGARRTSSLEVVSWLSPPPYTFALPGTKITDGLTILFIRDPNGILVELVHRPRSFFQRN